MEKKEKGAEKGTGGWGRGTGKAGAGMRTQWTEAADAVGEGGLFRGDKWACLWRGGGLLSDPGYARL